MESEDVEVLWQFTASPDCELSPLHLLWHWYLLVLRQWHFPSESPDPGDGIIAELAELGAELVSAVGYEKDKGKNKSYHLKAIAVVQCPWQEVLYLVRAVSPFTKPSVLTCIAGFRFDTHARP